MQFILVTHVADYEFCAEIHTLFEAESKEAVKKFLLEKIKLAWIDDHGGYLDSEIVIEKEMGGKIYDTRTLEIKYLLSHEYFDYKNTDFHPRCKIESKEDLELLIEKDIDVELYSLDEWFEQEKFTV